MSGEVSAVTNQRASLGRTDQSGTLYYDVLTTDISGKWSDGDKSWDLVSDEVKSEMGLHYMHDGEFWIEFFTDFCSQFEEVR